MEKIILEIDKEKFRHNLWWISILCIFGGAAAALPAKNSTQLVIGFGLMVAAGICALFMPKEI